MGTVLGNDLKQVKGGVFFDEGFIHTELGREGFKQCGLK